MTAAVQMPTDHEWLPHRCPSWCRGEHHRVLVELEESPETWRTAQEHQGQQIEQRLDEVRACSGELIVRPGGGGYFLVQAQRPTHANGVRDLSEVIRLEVEQLPRTRAEMDLLPGEARSLARRLIHLADQMELGE